VEDEAILRNELQQREKHLSLIVITIPVYSICDSYKFKVLLLLGGYKRKFTKHKKSFCSLLGLLKLLVI